MNLKIVVFSLGIFLLTSMAAFAGVEDKIYRNAQLQAKAGNLDFAFMYFNELDRDYPNSCYREQVLFVKGEYYYLLPGYLEATSIFKTFFKEFPKSNGKLFALAYLYRMAEASQNKEELELIKNEIVALQQVGFIFKESKEYRYRSPSFQDYRAVFRIKTIEFYRGGELFATVSY